MYFEHIFEKSLAQNSYFIGCQAHGTAIVIDPKRDIDTYLQIAKEQNLKITHITETHIHADYLSGSRELAAVTGAELLLSDEGGAAWQYEFAHTGLKDGDSIKVGNLRLDVLHTPGHTPESISFLLTDTPATDQPVMIFTGDFVFVGDIGRPDLLEEAAGIAGTKEIGAQQMYASLKKFLALPDYLQVWPAHGAGSACGKSLGAVASSTVGYEKIRNWALQNIEEQNFINTLLADQPEAPYYYAEMKRLNKVKRPLLIAVPEWQHLSKNTFDKALQMNLAVIDTRNKFDFANAHLPKSLNIQNNKTFNTWMGWIMNYEEQFVVIVDENDVEDVTRKLMRIGMDNVLGYITPEDLNQWNYDLATNTLIDADTLESYIDNDEILILDVRNTKEFKEGHIANAQHHFVGQLKNTLATLPKEQKIALHCQAGDRATIAQSLLHKHGFKNVENYSAGITEWKKLNKNLNK